MMDNLARDYWSSCEQPVVGLRYFNVYGPGEAHKGRMASMIWQLSQQMLSHSSTRLFRHGQQRRDFVYIKDVVQANLRAAGASRSGVYNVGSGQARQFNEVHEILSAALDVKPELEYVENPWGIYQDHTEADIEPTQRDLQYRPRYTLEMGIEEYAEEIRVRSRQESGNE